VVDETAIPPEEALDPEDIEDELDDLKLDIDDDLDEFDRQSLESLNLRAYWIKRLNYLQHEIDTRLWKARAVGGDDKDPDMLLELEDKCESAYIELRCSLVDTRQAQDVIVDARNELNSLKARVGSNEYPTGICGLIQSCLFEQKMGFRTSPHSKWNFSEELVDEAYRLALQGDEKAMKKMIAREVKKVDAGDNLYETV